MPLDAPATAVPARLTEAAVRAALRAAIETISPETDVAALRPDQPLRRQIDLDSMDWLNVLAAVEERLGITIAPEAQAQLATLDAIVAYALAHPPGLRAEGPGTALPDRRITLAGVPLTLRPMRREDADLEAAFVGHLSPEARYKRFMVTLAELPPSKLRYLTDVDQVRHVALVAVFERDGRPALAGAARYVLDPSGRSCEFAVAVDDAWQGTGLAGLLMQALIDVARARGVATMEGLVLATNTRMLKLARQLGFRAEHDPDDYNSVRVVRAL
jgi:acetyltransferase